MPHAEKWLVTALSGHAIGFPLSLVAEVAQMQGLTPVPGAAAGLAGLTHIRGRVLPVVDLTACLGLPVRDEIDIKNKQMNVIVRHDGTLYSFSVEAICDTQTLTRDMMSPLPQTLAAVWHLYSRGIYRLPDRLVVALDIPRLLGDFKGRAYDSR